MGTRLGPMAAVTLLVPLWPAGLAAGHASIEHGHVHDHGRQPDAGRWPGMHFIVQRAAQRVVGRQVAVFVHGAPG